jgi:hypothetical protein
MSGVMAGLASPAVRRGALIGLVGTSLLVAVSLMHGLTDPDYFWHHATGQLILDTGALPNVDPFSFTRLGAPWIADQWLAEVLITAMSSVGLGWGLALFGFVAGVGILALMLALLTRGTTVGAVAGAAAPALWLCGLYATMRPQVLSWSILGVELALLCVITPRTRWLALLLPPIFALWTNLHGLWVVGLAVGFIYLCFTLLGRTPMAPRRRWVAITGLLSAAAVLLTPYGIRGIAYLWNFADLGDWGARHLAEWQSPNFHDPAVLPLLGLIVVIVILGNRNTDGWLAAAAYFGVALSLYAVRNAPVAAVLAMPLVASELTARSRPGPAHAGSLVSNAPRARAALEAIAASAVIIAALWVGLTHYQQSDRLVDRFPVAAVDRLTEVLPDARVLAHYGWGGYVIDRMWRAGARVFVDGRNHLYGDSVLNEYSAIVAGDPEWEHLIARYRVTAILLRPDAALVHGIAQSAGWCEVFRDRLQVLLLRDCQEGVPSSTPAA